MGFAIGAAAGLRSMTPPAIVAWAAQSWPGVGESSLAFMANPITAWVLTAFAVGELIADKLPFIPSRLDPGPLVAELPKGPDNPFHAIVVEVKNVVRDGIARGEFRDVGDVHLAVELLSGVMRAGAERIGQNPAAFEATVRAVREIILAALAC